MTALVGYALYLDKPWFAGFMGAGTIISVASIFIRIMILKTNRQEVLRNNLRF